tara:strand:- start:4124 stop:7606 length:3483 start_codon:yes stop_codon:yes gene_type:complete
MQVQTDSKAISKYKSHTHKEHIYKIPDTYIGSVENASILSWKINDDKMVSSQLSYIPGLYKIVDEVIVNSWDQYIRCKDIKNKVTYISINFNKDNGMVTVENDGQGIDILMHPEHNIYTVEMIFGKLLTSTNYNEDEERITGGKNGYGAKLANIFSKYFEVETIDLKTKLKYNQCFKDNMNVREEPIINKITSKDKQYTRVSFLPDFNRFGIEKWSPHMMDIFKRRAYEISACCGNKLKVIFNEEEVPIRTFKDFCNMYFEDNNSIVFEHCGQRWEVAIGLADEFKHVSFVNGIYTSKGGKHVDYILQIVTKKLTDIILKKEKITVKPSYIREHLFLFINAIIVNPSFDSQTKDFLTTQSSKFGSTCKFTDKFFENLVKLGIIDKVVETYQFKESKQIKKTDGKKKNKIYGIPKLDDANEAGGKHSQKCTLILTEGDSAKAMAIAGLSVVGRDLYGVFPLRGKVINAREKITTKQGKQQVMNNTELIHMKQILGLEQDAKYSDTTKLRYGHIMIMTDQDYDGSHIKGLLINWLDTFWPDLLKIEGFVQCMQTPIVKMIKKKQEVMFYTIRKYEEWKLAHQDYIKKGWKAKYYKGLGTSTTTEAKGYFQNMSKLEYIWDNNSQDIIDMAFNRDRSDDRKDWLSNYDEKNILGENPTVKYTDFINQELIHFSNYDLHRSVPNIMDGFKPSQRKIIYSCFKRKLKSEIRVAQLAGYVSEHSGYHHGEDSLNKAIIAMAQNFVGSNNVHLLQPNGQFGTRILGGKDAGSPRYLHTVLADITQHIFIPEDEHILEYMNDDGLLVEPKYYAPIIPIILCNGCHGIGTGYSTSIPSYNPISVLNYVRNTLNDKPTNELKPYFHGFNGTIIHNEDNSIITKGSYEIINYKTILISELPIGTWIDNYKQFIDEIVHEINTNSTSKSSKANQNLNKFKEWFGVKNYISQSTESKPHFEIEIDPNVLSNWLRLAHQEQHAGNKIDNIEKRFRLTSKISTSNMHLYSIDGTVKKYKNPHDIFTEFYNHRLNLYNQRKEYILNKIKYDMDILKNKVRFINFVVDDTLDIRKYTKASLQDWLEEKIFMKDSSNSFAYLINMPMYQMTSDMVTQLRDSLTQKEKDYNDIFNSKIKDMWIKDLNNLEKHLENHMIKILSDTDSVKTKVKKPRKTKK